MSIIEIPLSSRKYPGLIALIDEEDYPLISQYKWSPYSVQVHSTPYARAVIDGRHVMMHRLLMEFPPQVDHKDGDGLNNTRGNLRISTQSQNRANSRTMSNNTSGFKGVSWHIKGQKWTASIRHNEERHHLGSFERIEDAAAAYACAAVELYGEFARIK